MCKMSICVDVLKLCFLFLVNTKLSAAAIDKNVLFLDTNDPEKDLADFILSKGYLPKDNALPKPEVKKHEGNDVTYLLSKLSDDDLVKLLNSNPKKLEYNLNDIVKVSGSKNDLEVREDNKHDLRQQDESKDLVRSRFRTVTSEPQAYFKLDNKPVETDTFKAKVDTEGAVHKLKNILYSRPVDQDLKDDSKKEMLFDILVTQLKSLCCKKKTPTKQVVTKPNVLQPLLVDFTKSTKKVELPSGPINFMFLIINDDVPINMSDKDGLISVDPESLDDKSSVLLLGPILQQLTNMQLKFVMNRITSELSRPEYLPLLQQIADGHLDPENMKLMKSLVTGPNTRRYIKPHRCNYQSKLARVFGGPRWIVCTGYLNLNQPSVYD